jgi:SAM-dependent methyltransferase
LPDEETLGNYYRRYYWQDNRGQDSKYLNLLFTLRMRPIINELKIMVPAKGRILDWGAGDGNLVRLLNENGFAASGIDPYSPGSNEKTIFKTTIHKAPFDDQYFDGIIGSHILEHVRNPIESIRSALRLLKPGGIFIIEVPNICSFQFRLFQSRWQPLEVPFHLNHFNPASLRTVLKKKFNLNVLKISFFSHRVSPSAFLLSLFPFFAPKLMRQKKGYYPTPIKIYYLLCQMAVYPFVLAEAGLKHGAIMRFYLTKQG